MEIGKAQEEINRLMANPGGVAPTRDPTERLREANQAAVAVGKAQEALEIRELGFGGGRACPEGAPRGGGAPPPLCRDYTGHEDVVPLVTGDGSWGQRILQNAAPRHSASCEDAPYVQVGPLRLCELHAQASVSCSLHEAKSARTYTPHAMLTMRASFTGASVRRKMAAYISA